MRSIKINWETLFFVVFGIHLLTILLSIEFWATVTKPLLLITLIAFYIRESRMHNKQPSMLVLAALAFSLLGDLLLLFQDNQELFFMLGLAAFLTAHIFYIVWFLRQIKARSSKANWLYVFLVIGYTASLLYLLWPGLGEMKLPVFIYGLVIATMLITAIGATLPFKKLVTPALFLLYGAKFFVISDSLLAINKFYQPFTAAGFLIMLTYGLAQYFLVKGILNRQEVFKKES